MESGKSARTPLLGGAIPGREEGMPVPASHYVNGAPMQGEFPGMEITLFAMGCFWGPERRFWEMPGVYSTAVGYVNGLTPNPTYAEVCSGGTGHAEAVQVVFESEQISYAALLTAFWQGHDPTQGMRQGNDVGTQYRSGIYGNTDEQLRLALASRDRFQACLKQAGLGEITTEIVSAPVFFYAEDYHQQYLAKNPHGYCGTGGTGIKLPDDWS